MIFDEHGHVQFSMLARSVIDVVALPFINLDPTNPSTAYGALRSERIIQV